MGRYFAGLGLMGGRVEAPGWPGFIEYDMNQNNCLGFEATHEGFKLRI